VLFAPDTFFSSIKFARALKERKKLLYIAASFDLFLAGK